MEPLKALVEERFCEAVRGRIELHSTCYRGTHDDDGRVWVTFDKEEIFSACSLTAWKQRFRLTHRLQEAGGIRDRSDPGYREICRSAERPSSGRASTRSTNSTTPLRPT